MVGPGERAVNAAKAGVRHRLDPAHVTPGCIAWMPWAGVIKVTHRDFHKGGKKGGGDGVEVIGGGATTAAKKPAAASKGGEGGGAVREEDDEEGASEQQQQQRPGRRAWNHPVIVLKRDGERVWVLAMTTYKGRSLEQKVAKYGEKTRRRLLKEVLPILPTDDHPLVRLGQKEYRGLKLDGDGRTHKMGYIKLGEVYAMDWRDLQRYGRESKRRYCLDKESAERLLRVFRNVNPRCAGLLEGHRVEATVDAARRPKADRGVVVKAVRKVGVRIERKRK